MFSYPIKALRQDRENVGVPRELELQIAAEACAGPEILFDPFFIAARNAQARLRSKCRNGEMPVDGISHAAEGTAAERDE